jgi:hypothetical protein
MKELFCPLNNLKIPYQINKRTTVKAKKREVSRLPQFF